MFSFILIFLYHNLILCAVTPPKDSSTSTDPSPADDDPVSGSATKASYASRLLVIGLLCFLCTATVVYGCFWTIQKRNQKQKQPQPPPQPDTQPETPQAIQT